ncbi:MAG TPA: CocE/NonD family hydrolase [Steroidobacteraceae bacterium]|nr:CocE/NonD family hydrolase [Steroidobacteraceae bacterium]
MPGARRRAATAVSLIACAFTLLPASAQSDVRVDRDVAVPMRDGVILRADLFRPETDSRLPVLVFRTPYGKHGAADSDGIHLKAVARGYAVLMQDVRGRYASDGHFDPYRQEGRDGYDTIEWASAQSWSDGRVGTYGLSYPGAVQWLAALERPPHLVAMAPAMTFSSPRRFFYMNGLFDRSWLPWIYQYVAPDARRRLGMPDEGDAEAKWSAVAGEFFAWLPLRDLPELRREAPYYFEWLAHPPEDPWWDWAELGGRYGSVAPAVLNLSGWYDDAYGVEGAATNFTGLRAARREDARERTHLVLGPWVHGAPSVQQSRAGDLDFGPAAAFDYDALVLDFHDHYLRGFDNRFSREPAVRYFVMGENAWRESEAWPPRAERVETLFLSGARNGKLRKLQSEPPPSSAPSSAIAADPRRPVTDPHGTPGAHDYRALAERDDVLTFETEPLADDWTIAGNLETRVFASCDCRDFDLWVRVQDVHPDGRAINVTSPGNDVVRASYRDPGEGRQSVEPGRVYELALKQALTAIRFGKGHRIRVQVSASFDPHLSRNLQTGASEVVSAGSRPATIRLHHGPDEPSRLLLPRLAGRSQSAE